FMKRWTVALSICCTTSTIYFLHGFFYRRLDGTWFGPAATLWAGMGVMSAVGALWAARRYRNAINNGDLETYLQRLWDLITLALMSLAGVGIVAVALAKNKLLQSPWLDFIAFSLPAWAALLAARGDRPRSVSTETVFLWALTFACFNVAALEIGRAESHNAFQQHSTTSVRGPKPLGNVLEL